MGQINAINRKIPGPNIKVCHNDIVIVDVTNKIPGRNLAIHWRGQPNQETPFMDGVPMVTQCPISGYTTFQYKFRASTPGTHMYHAFSNEDRAHGLFGSLVVKQADKLDPHKKYYDLDYDNHTILLSEWSNGSLVLINGRSSLNATTFHVKKGKRHKFRLIYASGLMNCPIKVSIAEHVMLVVALDGNDIHSHEAHAVVLGKGERVDFVLKSERHGGSYILEAAMDCKDKSTEESGKGSAIIIYEGHPSPVGISDVIPDNKAAPRRTTTFDTSLCEADDDEGKVCLRSVESSSNIQVGLEEAEVAKKIYLGFDYGHQLVVIDSSGGRTSISNKYYRMNNISFTFPPSPLLVQPDEASNMAVCNEEQKRCDGKEMCSCVHVEQIPLGSSVEVVLYDQGVDQEETVFHLHGYHFYVVGSRTFPAPLTAQQIQQLDLKNELVSRNLLNPVIKDTIRVPRNGVVVLRFLAQNAGYWMMRDEYSETWTRGMDILFQVGDPGDIAATPSNFPVCGNFIGPDFFLL
ncbi:unnamed protein product [Acanthoscelides obtectus]|nr:unnamed protein product [Acanthoscelides obtectus]CAK1621641.1 Laccase-15 [Acanthoscelides obtectus]